MTCFFLGALFGAASLAIVTAGWMWADEWRRSQLPYPNPGRRV